MADSVISVRQLTFAPHSQIQIPRFELKKNERVLLMGPSGCGKTSFLEFLAGFRPGRAEESRVAVQPAVVFQDLNLIEDFSVYENLALELSPATVQTALQTLTKLEFPASSKTLVKRLSKGEQQRLATARALALRRELLLADEPTSHLDRRRADQLMELLVTQSPTALVVSHDTHLGRFFDRVIPFEEIAQ